MISSAFICVWVESHLISPPLPDSIYFLCPLLSCSPAFLMQSENYIFPDEAALEPTKPRRQVSALWVWSHAAFFVVGLSLLVWLIYAYWTQIEQLIAHVGWGIALVIVLNIVRHFGRSFSMYMAVSPEHRHFKFRSALFARF